MADVVPRVEVVELAGEELVWMLVVVLVELAELVVLILFAVEAELVATLVVEVDEVGVKVLEVVETVKVVEDEADGDHEKVVVLKITGPYAPQVAFIVYVPSTQTDEPPATKLHE